MRMSAAACSVWPSRSGRLYYGVAEGPSVWSVSIDDEGDFGTDARIELEPKGTNASADITDILFDGAGMMILSQRGAIAGNYDYSTFAKPQRRACCNTSGAKRKAAGWKRRTNTRLA